MGIRLVEILQDDIVPPPQLTDAKVNSARTEPAMILGTKLSAAIVDLLMLHLSKSMQKICLGLLCVIILTVASSTAQDDRAFTAQGNLVRVPTLVRDASGALVSGLHVADFVIEDDGVSQPVHLDEGSDAEPVSMMIAVQCGRRAPREFGRMEGLASMLDPILSNPANEAAVLFFDKKLDLVQDFTSDGDKVEEQLKKLPWGDSGAAIMDAVAYSARLLGRRPEGRKRVLLLISETRDHGSKFTTLESALGAINSNDVSIYTLPFAPYLSQQLDDLRGSNKTEWSPVIDLWARMQELRQAMRKNIPQTLASITGGEYQLFLSRNGFEDHLIDFANHLHNRYELSFEPKDPHPGLHQIRVRLRDGSSNATLLYRTTYWVESQRGR
jgi:VWFA-related protein